MKLPKMRVPMENRAAFEKRLVIWTIMRDIFGGWEGLAEHLEVYKYVKFVWLPKYRLIHQRFSSTARTVSCVPGLERITT